MARALTQGGCFCGKVRFEIRARGSVVAFCHCPTCRKTASAPVTAWVVFPAAGFSYVKGKPVHFRSSAKVTREFCGSCGSPITCSHDARPEEIDVTTGSLDHPERFAPSVHIFTRYSLPWMKIGDQLPKLHETTPPKPRRARAVVSKPRKS